MSPSLLDFTDQTELHTDQPFVKVVDANQLTSRGINPFDRESIGLMRSMVKDCVHVFVNVDDSMLQSVDGELIEHDREAYRTGSLWHEDVYREDGLVNVRKSLGFAPVDESEDGKIRTFPTGFVEQRVARVAILGELEQVLNDAAFWTRFGRLQGYFMRRRIKKVLSQAQNGWYTMLGLYLAIQPLNSDPEFARRVHKRIGNSACWHYYRQGQVVVFNDSEFAHCLPPAPEDCDEEVIANQAKIRRLIF